MLSKNKTIQCKKPEGVTIRRIVTTALTKKQIRDIRKGFKLGREFMLLAQPLILEGKLQVIHLSRKEFEFLRKYIKHLGYAYGAKEPRAKINTKLLKGLEQTSGRKRRFGLKIRKGR